MRPTSTRTSVPVNLELARQEQDRLGELGQRQLRYADYAWQPPRQGGERRADDVDENRLDSRLTRRREFAMT